MPGVAWPLAGNVASPEAAGLGFERLEAAAPCASALFVHLNSLVSSNGIARMAALDSTDTVVALTPAAVARARELLANHGADAAGLRLGVKTTGCSGMSYKLDFADSIGSDETVIEKDGVKLVVERDAVMYVLGTEIDWVEDKMGAMFVFNNPNEKARCGCGESFSV